MARPHQALPVPEAHHVPRGPPRHLQHVDLRAAAGDAAPVRLRPVLQPRVQGVRPVPQGHQAGRHRLRLRLLHVRNAADREHPVLQPAGGAAPAPRGPVGVGPRAVQDADEHHVLGRAHALPAGAGPGPGPAAGQPLGAFQGAGAAAERVRSVRPGEGRGLPGAAPAAALDPPRLQQELPARARPPAPPALRVRGLGHARGDGLRQAHGLPLRALRAVLAAADDGHPPDAAVADVAGGQEVRPPGRLLAAVALHAGPLRLRAADLHAPSPAEAAAPRAARPMHGGGGQGAGGGGRHGSGLRDGASGALAADPTAAVLRGEAGLLAQAVFVLVRESGRQGPGRRVQAETGRPRPPLGLALEGHGAAALPPPPGHIQRSHALPHGQLGRLVVRGEESKAWPSG